MTLKKLRNKRIVFTASLVLGVFLFLYFLPQYNFSRQVSTLDFKDETLLLVGSSLVDSEHFATSPMMIFINPRDWSMEVLNLNTFPGLRTRDSIGTVEAESFLLNGEPKWVVSTRYPGKVLILGNRSSSGNTLEVEFEEDLDIVVRAIAIGDVTGDGKEEIVVGTRPKGILKYYTYENGQWLGTTIDNLGGTIHDLLVADLNGDGVNEILLTTHIPLHQITPEEEMPKYTPKMLTYEFDQEQGTWIRSVIADYTTTKPLSEAQRLMFPNLNFDEYYQHPRYLFFDDFAGGDAKEIVTNLRGGKQKLLALKRQETGYVQVVIEDELRINRQVVAVGDITNNGRAEIIATNSSDTALLLYGYEQGTWKRTIIAEDLAGESPPAGEARDKHGKIVQFVYILQSPEGKYKNILYMVSGHAADTARFYLLSYISQKDVWEKELVAEIKMGIQAWHITSAFSKSKPRDFPLEGNVFLPCEIIQGTSERYGCYKDAALFAAQNEASVQELFTFIDESPKSWHSKEHAIGRAVLIASDYNLQLAGEKCAAAKRGCTSGYGHGLALSWGEYTKKTSPSDSDIEKNANVLMSFMETFCPLCYHYLGHYYGSVSDTIQQNLDNLDLCDSIIDDSKFLDCAMGVIHQHFQNKVPDVKNFFAKCQSHASTRKQEACYNHGSRYFARWYVRDTNIKGALSVCQELNKEVPPEWNWCYEGIGEWLFSKGITPDTSWCNALPAAVNEICRRDLTTPPQRALGRFDAELECDSKFGCQIPPGI